MKNNENLKEGNIKNTEHEIIFISYYDEHALKTISMNAAGYITKPIKATKLLNAVSNGAKNIENKDLLNILVNCKYANNDILAIPNQSKIELIKAYDILYLEADGRYTIFHMANGNIKIACKNLGEYEKLLNVHVFFRTHHRYIVNLNLVTNIIRTEGNYCELLNHKTLPIAKRRIDDLCNFLNLK